MADYLKKILTEYYGVISGKALSIGFSFVFTYLITNCFNTDRAGQIFVTLSVIQFLVLLSKIGQDQLIVKQNSSIEGSVGFNNSITLVIISTLTITSIAFIVGFVVKGKINSEIPLYILLSVIPLSIIWVYVGYFRSLKHQFSANFLENGLFYMIFTSLFLKFNKDIYDFLYLFLLSSLISLILVMFYARRIGLRYTLKNSKVKSVLSTGAPIMTSSVLSFLILNTPIYFASFLGNNSDITFYSVCIKVSLFINLGVAIVNSLYAPRYASAFRNEKINELRALYFKARRELLVISSIPLLFIFISPDSILSVFNISSNQNTLLLIMFSITQFICVSTGTTGVFLNIVNKEKALRKNTAIGLSLTLFSCTLLPIIGLNAMLIAYTIGVLFENLASYFSVKKVLDEKN